MESSGTTPPGGQSPAAVPDISAAFDGPGPFVTVYLGTEAAIEQAAQRNELRWKNLRLRLEKDGAAPEALAAIAPLVPEAHHLGRTLAVVADATGLRRLVPAALPAAGREPLGAERQSGGPPGFVAGRRNRRPAHRRGR